MKLAGIILFVFVCLGSFAQKSSTIDKKALKAFGLAQEAYHSSNYSKAMEILDEILINNPDFQDAYLMKSDIYKDMDSVDLQINAINSALKINSENQPRLYFILGNAYYKKGLYPKSQAAYSRFLEITPENDPNYAKSKLGLIKCMGATELFNNPVPFKAVNLGEGINSDDDEYWPSLTVDGKTLIFTRLLKTKSNVNSNKLLYQEDFYTSVSSDGKWQLSEPLTSINTRFNEGAQSISSDGKLLFFTACNRSDSKGSCDIYWARNKDGIWSVPQNAGNVINTTAWESQPSISANGEYLYFVSNRKGGKGGMDIWKCNLKGFSEYGQPIWGKPVNMGDSINTPGNEMSPFIHSDGKTLYFASDNWQGLGGYDVFYSRQLNDSVWTKPKNLGYPINSYKDEQGLIVDASGKNVYYSSDRPGAKGKDIYSFELYESARPSPVSYIKGKVVDEETGAPVCAKVELIDLNNPAKKIVSESCWDIGEFLMCLPLGSAYAFNISSEGYLFYSQNFELKEKTEIIDPYSLIIKLKKIKVGESVVLRNVFFNYGSFELMPESKVELQKLIDFMNFNQTLVIEISGHTDNIGSQESNQKLSEMRAREVFEYLRFKGINETRMTYKGFGFSVPLADNDTPEGRSVNRRTEFRVINK